MALINSFSSVHQGKWILLRLLSLFATPICLSPTFIITTSAFMAASIASLNQHFVMCHLYCNLLHKGWFTLLPTLFFLFCQAETILVESSGQCIAQKPRSLCCLYKGRSVQHFFVLREVIPAVIFATTRHFFSATLSPVFYYSIVAVLFTAPKGPTNKTRI